MTDKTITGEIEQELTLEEYTTVLAEIPFVISLGEGEEYSGPPNKKLAFLVSEELGLEGCSALLRFANLAMRIAKLEGETLTTPNPTKSPPLQDLLDRLGKAALEEKDTNNGPAKEAKAKEAQAKTNPKK